MKKMMPPWSALATCRTALLASNVRSGRGREGGIACQACAAAQPIDCFSALRLPASASSSLPEDYEGEVNRNEVSNWHACRVWASSGCMQVATLSCIVADGPLFFPLTDGEPDQGAGESL